MMDDSAPVKLAAAVVADHDGIGACGGGDLRVFDIQNSTLRILGKN